MGLLGRRPSAARGAGGAGLQDAGALMSSARLTIVNADDWGYEVESTDRALECLLAGRLTSLSALVYMSDSLRASQLAGEKAVAPIGLHLNVTEPYDATAVSPSVRERQARVVPYFRSRRLMRWVYNPCCAPRFAMSCRTSSPRSTMPMEGPPTTWMATITRTSIQT